MKNGAVGRFAGSVAVVVFAIVFVPTARGDEPPHVGPGTESRFPPLVVPTGFKATLFACDPLVEYPSVIALGPRPGSVYVAYDYMTGLGTEIVRRDEIRLVEDVDGDGYADKSTVFAGGFNSIQGLAYHAGTVFAMHAPLLTALEDTDGDGVADTRRDLLSGLGLLPENNSTRLHCANGVVVGHDGWLYLAMGDNGTDVMRPEGDRLLLQGGGILRCRPDGCDLHIFATGLRNIYDVALDEALNVFVRDNENDGGDYMIRVYHSFAGADHGYPYHYYERPGEAMPPLADLGRGSSAGGVCYLETAFPAEYHGSLFFCEWGRAVVRYERRRSGSSFAPMKEVAFAAGAPKDPYGFKPTDVIVDRDGSLLVSDWGDDQRPKRGRGRLYRIAYVGPGDSPTEAAGSKSKAAESSTGPEPIEQLVAKLGAPGEFARVQAQEALERRGREEWGAIVPALQNGSLNMLARMHAVRIRAHIEGRVCVPALIELAKSDADPQVRAQAVRAIADLSDPRFASTAQPAVMSSSELARQLAEIAIGQEPAVLLEIVIALGRLRWADAPTWLRDHLAKPDAALAHAAMQTLRRANNWPEVLTLLDLPDDNPIRRTALAALAEQPDPVIVDGLMARLRTEGAPQRRRDYADALSRVYKKPGPWVYWGYRASPRPANSVAWESTNAIEESLDGVLADSDHDVRAAILRRMQRESIPVHVATLGRWLSDEPAADRAQAILDSLAKASANESRPLLEQIVGRRGYTVEVRRNGLKLLLAGLDASSQQRLLNIAKRIEDGPLLAELLLEMGKRPTIDSRRTMLAKLESKDVEVRAAALEASTVLKISEASPRVFTLLDDENPRVRRAAVTAAGAFLLEAAAAKLLTLTHDGDAAICSASFDSLRSIHNRSAVAAAVAALDQSATQRAAIDYLAEFGAAEHAAALLGVVSNNRSIDVLASVVRALANWESREPWNSPRRAALSKAIADVQGQSGVVLRWQVSGPLAEKAAAARRDQAASTPEPSAGMRTVLAAGRESQADLAEAPAGTGDSVWLATSEIAVAEPTRAQLLWSSNRPLQIWVNGQAAVRSATGGPSPAASDRYEAEFVKGANRVAVQLDAGKPAQFSVRFRRLSSSAEQERLVQYALQNSGSANRGRDLFRNAEKSSCVKCHRIGETGATIGPDLTGVGERFARIHIIESILEPSRTIAPGYDSIAVVLSSGQVVTGVKMSEDDSLLILGDDKGQRHEIPKADIEQRTIQRRSTMPDGLEKQFSNKEFLDLVTYLVSERRTPGR